MQKKPAGLRSILVLCLSVAIIIFLLNANAFGKNTIATNSFPEVADLPVQTNPPDVMTMMDGTKVTTPKQWKQRREEMKAILEHYELGHAPPPPGNVSGKDIQSRDLVDGTVKFRLVHLSFGPHKKLGIDIAIFTPVKVYHLR